jgi:hypothetical protein
VLWFWITPDEEVAPTREDVRLETKI